MPHSPRIHAGDSALAPPQIPEPDSCRTVGSHDRQRRTVIVQSSPAFARGHGVLSGPFAFVGLSKIRESKLSSANLPITAKGIELRLRRLGCRSAFPGRSPSSCSSRQASRRSSPSRCWRDFAIRKSSGFSKRLFREHLSFPPRVSRTAEQRREPLARPAIAEPAVAGRNSRRLRASG